MGAEQDQHTICLQYYGLLDIENIGGDLSSKCDFNTITFNPK